MSLQTGSGNVIKRRAIVVVIDGCGVGAAPDVERFGDLPNCNTVGNTADFVGGMKLPNLARLGLGNITKVSGVDRDLDAIGFYGKLQERSNGKDTQTGHWEMMGVESTQAFPLYPNGFPDDVIDRFVKETGCGGILSNKPASGTEILEQLGEEHRLTRYPIVYTSGDSVFQIATNVEVIPLETLYRWSEIARRILQGKHRVGRVIARPFKGSPGNYERLSGDRHDYAVPPPSTTFLDSALASGMGVFGIGKIEDIFVGHGLSHAKHTGTNLEGLKLTLDAVKGDGSVGQYKIKHAGQSIEAGPVQLIFTNLVDTDSAFGHRRNAKGYAGALVEIDEWLGKTMQAMRPEDLLIISSDHGNDPTAPGTDHTREFVPLLAYSPSNTASLAASKNIGVRDGFFDIAATLGQWLSVDWQGPGVSFIKDLSVVA